MSDFINNPDIELNKNLADKLRNKQEYLKNPQNVTYDINNNNFSLNYSDGTSINMYSTSQMLNYYFGENLADVVKNDKIYIVHQSSYDMLFYEGTFIGYGVPDDDANAAVETVVEEIKVLVKDPEFADTVTDIVENNTIGSISSQTIVPNVLKLVDEVKDSKWSDIYSSALSIALICYHLNNTGDDNSSNSSEWLNAVSNLLSFDGNPFTSVTSLPISGGAALIVNESEKSTNINISINGYVDLDYDTIKPADGRSFQEWLEENGFAVNRGNVIFDQKGNITITINFEEIMRNYYDDVYKENHPDSDFISWFASVFGGVLLYKLIEKLITEEDETVTSDTEDMFSKILSTIYSAFAAAKAEKPCTQIYSSSIFFSHILDPLILDLDGDGYNVENKENGTNFDLDKNGFAEKINWTIRDGFSTKINVKPS